MTIIFVPTRVEAQHFGNANVISAAGAYYHSAAVIDDGTLFTWGREDQSNGLGHASGILMWVPTRVDPGLMGGASSGPVTNCSQYAPWHLPWERILGLADTATKLMQW